MYSRLVAKSAGRATYSAIVLATQLIRSGKHKSENYIIQKATIFDRFYSFFCGIRSILLSGEFRKRIR
jgi:hypothetical protein